MIIVEVEGGVVVGVYNHSTNKNCEELVGGKDYMLDDHDNLKEEGSVIECLHSEVPI